MTDMFLSVEKRILMAYREFFGEEYVPSQKQNTDIHVRVHKMCYLMSRIDCDIIDDGFVWNTFGPFSVDLQEVLKQVDTKRDALREFYQNYAPNDILDADILEGIDRLKNGLQVSSYKENSRYWVELLASIAFIAHSELPTSAFDYINAELKGRKSAYVCDAENKKAWILLNELGVVN